MQEQLQVSKLRDPKFYLENFCKIKGKTPGYIPFILNDAQKDLYNSLNKSSRVIILKARQIGFSTAATGYFYHRTITSPGTTTALIGYNSDMVTELLDKVKTFYRTTPEALRPKIHYNSKYEISFPAIDSKILVLPSSENVGRGYTLHNVLCVSGDTVVYGRDGKSMIVSNVKDGDTIINGNGGFSTVKRLVRRNNVENMLSFDVVGAPDALKVTKDHEIYVRDNDSKSGKWIAAKNVVPGMRIGVPYYQCRHRVKEVDLDEFWEYNNHGLSSKKIGAVKTNRALGRLVGWYLAEGTATKGKVTFSVHVKEIDIVKKVINDVLGAAVLSPLVRIKGNGATITYHNVSLSKWFVKKFGHGASEKTIPDLVWYWGWDFCKGLILGLFEGDGCFTKKQRVHLVTTSAALAAQVRRLMVSLRIGLPSVRHSDAKRYGKQCKERWDIILLGPGNYKFRREFGLPLPEYSDARNRWRVENAPGANLGKKTWLRGKTHYWAKIRNVIEVDAEDVVYDIVLSGNPHSFLTSAGVVHNCTELAFWDKPEEKMLAIENAVPKDGKIVIESTPNGVGNLYHRMWVSDNDYVKKEYGWWWMYTQEDMDALRKRIGDPRRFAQEYELEFLATGRPVFDSVLVKNMRQHILQIGAVVKTDIGDWVVQKVNDLTVYKPPRPGGFYVVGADVAEGVEGGDSSVAVIFDKTTGEEVAFYRGHLPADEFGYKLNEWGRYFNNALMAVEINNHGLTTVTALRNRGYPALYFRPSKFDATSTPLSDRLGWKTTQVTRPLMIDDLAEAMRNSTVLFHSKEVLDEMLTFVYNDAWRMEAQQGFHDDCIFASAISYQGFKVLYDKPLDQIDYEAHLPKSSAY